MASGRSMGRRYRPRPVSTPAPDLPHWRARPRVNRLRAPATRRRATSLVTLDVRHEKEALMAEVHGTCTARFDAVRTTLADQIETGADLGASVAVFLHGEPVVDIWGGWADAEKTRPWERDTITNVWSTT